MWPGLCKGGGWRRRSKERALKISLKMPIISFSSRKPFLGVGISYLNAFFSNYFLYGFIEHNNMFLFKGSVEMSHFNSSDFSDVGNSLQLVSMH
jgi:hypothetical protein